MSPDFPNENDNPDTDNKPVPPYADRQKSGEVDSQVPLPLGPAPAGRCRSPRLA